MSGFKLGLESTVKTSPKYSLAARTGESNKFDIAVEKPSADADLGIDIEKRGQSLLVRAIKDGAVKEWNAKNPYKTVKVLDAIVAVQGKGGTSADIWDGLQKAEGSVRVTINRNNEAAPGPGRYGVPSVEEKYKAQPCFTFGAGGRPMAKEVNKDERRGRQPGPGAYMPFESFGSSKSGGFGFGTAAKIPVKKPMQAPDPGAYKTEASTLIKRQVSLGAKRIGKRSLSMPGPGAYMPQFSQTETNLARSLLDTAEDRSKAGNADIAFRAALPGPGQYAPMRELGGGNMVTQRSPDFTFAAKRKPLRRDQSDVNFHVAHYTTFH
mmetsp:Transcript_43631/g.112754  ORF Transcript_43631/g.112754 Transcript_43631/m.112754 type:complete len:323 (-) Transcript_43631:76-1044(-)